MPFVIGFFFGCLTCLILFYFVKHERRDCNLCVENQKKIAEIDEVVKDLVYFDEEDFDEEDFDEEELDNEDDFDELAESGDDWWKKGLPNPLG